MVTPSSLLEFDLASRAFKLLKQQPVPNYDASKYVSK
jgi:protease II